MYDELQAKIKTLNTMMWSQALPWTDVERWLAGFGAHTEDGPSEPLHALFLLSHFTFFTAPLLRVLLRALFRDLVQYPIIARLRKRNRDTLDWSVLQPAYDRALRGIRFIGMGNPSESGTHLLYYFRQENGLDKALFVHSHELFEGTSAKPRLPRGLKHIIFLDDFCGSGRQAVRYSRGLLDRIRATSATVRLSYYPVFATSAGLLRVREKAKFNDVQTAFEFDESFRALEADSRYFRETHDKIDRAYAAEMCRRYGQKLSPSAPVGYGDCQLLLGFAHNVPNNTLPIFWADGAHDHPWHPVFPRIKKGPGW